MFASDTNPATRSKVYDFSIVNTGDNVTPAYVGSIVEASDAQILSGHAVLAKSGRFNGTTFTSKEFWYNGVEWKLAQQKTTVNQAPAFDMFDEARNSYGDTTYYVNSSFTGTKIFSYRPGTGTNDPILGFPLSSRTFNNVGDIQFDNNFDADTFSYLVSPITKTSAINEGYLKTITGLDKFT